MDRTTNYGLKKPRGTEFININDFNENADIIDGKLKENEDAISTAEENAKKHADDKIAKIPDPTIENIEGLQAALDQLENNIGTLSSLSTTAKENLVAAVNELKNRLDNLDEDTGESLTQIINSLNDLSDDVAAHLADFTSLEQGYNNHTEKKVTDAHEPLFQGYREAFQRLSSTSPTINADNYNVFLLPITGATSITFNTTLADCVSITVFIEQGASPHSISFPASVKWKGEEVPDLSGENKTYILTFVTYDTGVSWLGAMAGEF